MFRPVAIVALLAMSGCAAEETNPAQVHCVLDGLSVDETAGAIAAVEEWEAVTPFRCYVIQRQGAVAQDGDIVVRIGMTSTGLDASTIIDNSKPDMVIRATVIIEPGRDVRPFLAHEIGHALGLRYDGDPHYEGTAPSVMHHFVYGSDVISPVDLAAFHAKWDR